MTLTIAVCTRNRAPILAEALAHLRTEIGETPAGVDVLLVDNGSTDGTPDVAIQLADWPAFQAVREETPGLSHARNRALAESDADWVAFLDDDAFVWTGWLDEFQRAADQPGVGLIGGPMEPRYEVPPPRWFDRSASRRTFGDEGPLADRPARFGFTGANVAANRQMMLDVGGFDPDLGMIGGRLGLGEETDLAAKLFDRFGNVTWYAPRMGIDHLEPERKQHAAYVAERAYINGRQTWRFLSGGRAVRSALSAAKGVKQATFGVANLLSAIVRPVRAHAALRQLATGAGAFAGAVDVWRDDDAMSSAS
ncbi:MAG: glycosyltransferase [Bacteroidota bacterium]